MSAPTIDIEDIQADVGPLVQLLGTVAFLMQVIPRDHDDKEQDQATDWHGVL